MTVLQGADVAPDPEEGQQRKGAFTVGCREKQTCGRDDVQAGGCERYLALPL